jgi:uncharacterized membrane protein
VAFALTAAGRHDGATEICFVVATIVAIALSWTVVHTTYAVHYAHLYYRETSGGIGFPGDEPPCYVDFAYLAFTVGMTFQVSDTTLDDAAIRHQVLGHALLSFVFGTVILATAVNGVASLIR